MLGNTTIKHLAKVPRSFWKCLKVRKACCRNRLSIAGIYLGNPNGLGDFLTSSRHFGYDPVSTSLKIYSHLGISSKDTQSDIFT